MKLEPNCIRDTLIVIEANTYYHCGVTYPDVCFKEVVGKYSDMTVRYHLIQMSKANLIELQPSKDDYYINIIDLSPSGHEFLSNIRSNNVWGKLLSVCSSAGSFSIDIMQKVSTSLILEIIKEHLSK